MPEARAHAFFVVPHTHWDREWYQPFEYFQLALARVVDQVIDVLERDPEFTSFTLDGQAIVLEDYLEARPDNEKRLLALVQDGRIEVGPSYVLPDEFLVGAEPLVRNLLIGRAVCGRFGAQPSPVGYLPDSFGHPLQLPQILAGFGIESFIFSRGMGDELADVGCVFRWRAPDGSEVLSFQLLDHYGNFAGVHDVDDCERRVDWILEHFGDLLNRVDIPVLLCNGTDHVPITPSLPRLLAVLQERRPGSEFRLSRYADYVTAVGPGQVPEISGELLGSRIQNVLRGVNSARMYVKRANEEAERRLLCVETLGALRTLHDGLGFPAADFSVAWRQLLRCHPHDTICGCSCDEVHRDALARYESLHRSLSVLERRALGGLASGPTRPGAVGVLNPLPYRRRRVVEIPGRAPTLVELDGFSAATVTLGPERPGPEPASAPAGAVAIENDILRVEALPDGTLDLVDKVRGRRIEGLHVLEDEPDRGDLYNFCPVENSVRWRSGHATARVVSDGPVVYELEVRVQTDRPAGLDADGRPLEGLQPVGVSTIVRLVEGSRRVEFRTTIDNAARDHRLRVGFPTGPAEREVRAETAFGVARRPPQPPSPRVDWVEPPDPTQHTLGAVSFGSIGLVTKGLPEYEAELDGGQGRLCITLLRCVGIISQPDGLPTRPHTAGPGVNTPEGQCLGRHVFEYALLPDGGELDDVALLRESQDYRYGFLVSDTPMAFTPDLALEGDVVFSSLKGAEDGDGLILRCFNPSRSTAPARVRGPVTVSLTRLDETGEEALPDGMFELRVGQIATLRIRR